MPDVALPEKRKVGSSTLPLTTSFERGFSALTSAIRNRPRFDIMVSEHD